MGTRWGSVQSIYTLQEISGSETAHPAGVCMFDRKSRRTGHSGKNSSFIQASGGGPPELGRWWWYTGRVRVSSA